MAYRKLLPVIGGHDLQSNFDTVAAALSKIAWAYPDTASIFMEGGVYSFPVLDDDEDVDLFPIDSRGIAVSSIAAGSDTIDYVIGLTGVVPLIASDASTAIFGADPAITNAALLLVELPTKDYKTVKLALGAGAAAALTDQDVIVGEDVAYLALPAGFYDSSETVTPKHASFTLSYNGASVKYAFASTGYTLKTGT